MWSIACNKWWVKYDFAVLKLIINVVWMVVGIMCARENIVFIKALITLCCVGPFVVVFAYRDLVCVWILGGGECAEIHIWSNMSMSHLVCI